MPSRTTPKVLYTDQSRRCQRCGMVVLPQAAYCSTCGEHQSMAYSSWQVFVQLIRLWLMVVVVVYALVLAWRILMPVTVLVSPPCADVAMTLVWLMPRTADAVPIAVTTCASVSVAPLQVLTEPWGALVVVIAERLIWVGGWLAYGESVVWQTIMQVTQTLSVWWANTW